MHLIPEKRSFFQISKLTFYSHLVAWGAMLVTWITLELPELSEDPIDWFPTGTRAISIVEPRYTRKFKVIQESNLELEYET